MRSTPFARLVQLTATCGLLMPVVCFDGTARAQMIFGSPDANLTVEAYANTTGSFASSDADGSLIIDGALRVLGLVQGGDSRLGARAVVAGLAGELSDVDVTDLSLLWLTGGGRFEFGERAGLPATLTGYPPNGYVFTSAEYGPASGLSLDPGGGLAASLLGPADGGRIQRLNNLGAMASLSNDRSAKLIYVSPKWRGLQGGISYAPDVDAGGHAFDDLLQVGLTREQYSGRHVLRYGGSFNHAGSGTARELRSFNAGFSALLDDAWLIGLSAGYDSGGIDTSSAWGTVTSINYNRGQWTWGGYLQFARSNSSDAAIGTERLRVAEIGVSFRSNRKLRWFAAFNMSRLDDLSGNDFNPSTLVVGVRTTI